VGCQPEGRIVPNRRKEVRLTRGVWKRRAGVVLAAAAAGVMVTTGTAYANDAYVEVLDGSGNAVWIENGDTLSVCDTKPDGWGVRGYIYVPDAPGSADGAVMIKASDPSADGDCVAASMNVPEQIDLSMKVCNYKGASIIFCNWVSIPGRPSQGT